MNLVNKFKPYIYLPISNLASGLLGFKRTLRILTLLGLDKSWTWYLVNRRDIPSYFYSLLALDLMKKGDTVLDIGCGAGHYLPEIENKVSSGGNVIGVDISDLNLLFARKFFVGKNTKLINLSVEKKLPFIDKSADVIHSNDTFQYIKNKDKFISECFRVLKTGGRLIVLQTLSKPQGNILGIGFAEVKDMLVRTGFKKMGFYSNRTLLQKIKGNKSFKIGKSDNSKNLKSAFSYSFFAVKGRGNYSVSASNSLQKKFLDTEVNYSQEPWLTK